MSVKDASKILIDDSRVMLQIVMSLTNGSMGVIYDCNMFLVHKCTVFPVKIRLQLKCLQWWITLAYSAKAKILPFIPLPSFKAKDLE